MSLDPQIPLSVNIPQQAPVSPLGSIAQLMQLRGIDSEIALRNAQAQQAQQQSQNVAAEARQRQRDLADQNFLQQASLDPNIHKQLALGDTSGIAGHVQLKTEQALQANALKIATDRATLNTTQLTQRNTGASEIASTVAGLLNLKDANGNPDLAKINENLPSAIDGLTKSGALTAVGIDPAKLQGQQVTSVDQLHQLAASMGAETEVNDKILAQKKTAAETAASAATTAETNQKVALLTRKIAATDAMGQPGGLEQMVNGRIPAQFPQFRADALAAAQNAGKLNPGDPGKVAEAIEKVAAQADEIQKNADPTNIGASATKARADAAAVSPITTQTAVNTAVRTRAAEAAQAPPALRGIVDPTIRAQVSADQQKANEEYQTKVADSTRLQQFVDAARSGNQAAMKLVPIAEVRDILSRVTNTELGSAGTGVTMKRRALDYLSNTFQGRPTEDTLGDIENVGKMVLTSAKTAYQGKVQNFNNQGASFPLEPTGAPPAPKPIALKDGTTLTPHSAADEARFRKDHPDLIR